MRTKASWVFAVIAAFIVLLPASSSRAATRSCSPIANGVRCEGESFHVARSVGAVRGKPGATSGGHLLRLKRDGSATLKARLPSASRLKVRARGGRYCRGWPHMVVVVSGRRVLSRTIARRSWRSYHVAVTLAAGVHKLRVTYDNHRSSARCRRNLRVDYIDVTGPIGATGPTEATGASMPTEDLPGWHLVFGDDFNSGLDRSKWRRWSGQPGSSAGGWWDPSHVVVSNGVLNLNTYRDPNFGNKWVSGGVSNAYALKQAYGKYESRFRMDAGHGVQGILLLWPVVGWPPEIDFWEAGGIASPDLRNAAAATLHYGTTNSQIQRTVYADFSQWHTIGVEWTPGKLTYTLDGQGWATVSDLNVPSQPMEMDLMTQAGTCGDRWAPCPDSTTPTQVNMQVDWVVNWAYVP